MADRNKSRLGPVVLSFVVLSMVVVMPVWAQDSRRGDRIIHRYLDPGRWLDSEAARSGQDGARGSGAPEAQRPAPAEGEAPGLWMMPGEDEWIWTSQGPLGPQGVEEPHGPLDINEGETDLDDKTDRVDSLSYQASFDPSVVPFKRGVVHNKVRRRNDGRYTAWLEVGAFQQINVGGGPRAGEDRFWGSFLLRIEPGERHSIPSVGPEQRILTVETEPGLEVDIERDGADNFYLSADHEGLLRVNMEIMVARDYFNAAFEETGGWDAFGVPGGSLEAGLRQVAAGVLEMIGVSREASTPVEALRKLVEHYRDFEGRPFPEDVRGDRYVEISQRKIGVCRHRSLTFMISAEALGITTRYVYNEAHAFVEVYWPGQGWRRIDLGGAADAFNYQNQQGGRVHDGAWEDELPRPPAYEEELARMGGGGSEADSGGDSSEGGLSSMDSEEDGLVSMGAEMSEDAGPVGEQEMEISEDSVEVGPQILLLEAAGEVFRGQPLRVRGRVDPATPGEDVRVYLVPSGANEGRGGVQLGEARVDEDGFFEGEWTVPREVGLGRWRLEGRVR